MLSISPNPEDSMVFLGSKIIPRSIKGFKPDQSSGMSVMNAADLTSKALINRACRGALFAGVQGRKLILQAINQYLQLTKIFKLALSPAPHLPALRAIRHRYAIAFPAYK